MVENFLKKAGEKHFQAPKLIFSCSRIRFSRFCIFRPSVDFREIWHFCLEDAQSGWLWEAAGGHGDRGGQVYHVWHLRIITGDAQYVQEPRGVARVAPGALTVASGGWILISYSMINYRPFKKRHLLYTRINPSSLFVLHPLVLQVRI